MDVVEISRGVKVSVGRYRQMDDKKLECLTLRISRVVKRSRLEPLVR